MADILKVTAPMVGKQIVQPNKAILEDPSIPFDLQEINHIIKNGNSSGLLGQHNVFQNETGAAVLMNLLKDPDVTVNYLKNIYMLEEIISLLPVNNNTVTQEIQQLFEALLIQPDQIVEELERQEFSSTLFKGPLFEFLRGLAARNPGLKQNIAELLKAMNGELTRKDVMDSVANNLEFISDQVSGSSVLAARVEELAVRCRQVQDPRGMDALKTDILSILKNVEDSILYSPQIAKIVPIIIYNLSRFQDNSQYLKEALLNVLVHVNGRDNKENLKVLVQEYMDSFMGSGRSENHSRIMNILAQIISKQDQEANISSLNGEKIEKIITSLLSSPCNYTPLLHFVIPVEYQGLHAFSELWIDPNESRESGTSYEEGSNSIHVLITIDIHEIGEFEAEFKVRERNISFALLCPPGYEKLFQGLEKEFQDIISGHGYHVEQIAIGKMEGNRSLMDVFQSLPFKRTGVDVKI